MRRSSGTPRGAEAEDAGDGGHYEDIPAGEQGPGGRVAELVQLLVDIGVLLDVGVGAGQVGLGLVVVVVADEVLDGVVGQEVLELGGELGCEGLVVGNDQRGALYLLDCAGHREGLAAAGDAHEGLVPHAALDSFDDHVDCLGLVAGRPEVGGYLELAG